MGCKGQLTMEEITFSLKHYWRFVDSAALELQGLSWGAERSLVCIEDIATKLILFPKYMKYHLLGHACT